ncbi:putative ATPase [Bacteroidales bacterium Barb4]|nr:putative ATPase [Bacteroidales bacterium Barb4]
MKLKRFIHKSDDLDLDINFNKVSLIVGQNAVGKSRTIGALDKFVKIILQQQKWLKNVSCEFHVDFIDDNNKELSYSYIYERGIVTFEHLLYDNIPYLIRNKEKITLEEEPINPPTDKLILHVRRDTVSYPFIEKIIYWAENTYGLLFDELYMFDFGVDSSIGSAKESITSMFEKLDDNTIGELLSQMKSLEYFIEDIRIEEIGKDFKLIVLHEKDVADELCIPQLSNGISRALSLLIFVNYLSTLKQPQTLIIDDFCEGLDYNRATKLGKLLYEFCLEHKVQLITASNDSFLMEVVDLKYWILLQREGSKINVITQEKYPKLFDDFDFTGLSNFDFFASDFIAGHTKDIQG